MRKRFPRWLTLLAVLVVLVAALGTTVSAAGNPTEEPGSKMIVCADCNETGLCMTCYGQDPVCSDCGGTFLCSACGGTGYVESPSHFYNTVWGLLPPVIAIALALITKEVYSSLFIGILVGGLLYSNFSFEGTVRHVFLDGIVASLSNSYNVGILIFLVILGAMVCLMNRAGGSAAFGRWAQTHIKSRVGAQLTTVVLGCLIFIDDRRQRDAPGDGQTQNFPGKVVLYHRCYGGACLHHRPHLLLGGGRGCLCRRWAGAEPVHSGHPL